MTDNAADFMKGRIYEPRHVRIEPPVCRRGSKVTCFRLMTKASKIPPIYERALTHRNVCV